MYRQRRRAGAPRGEQAKDVLRRLETGTPAIYADPSAAAEGRILFGPMSLKTGEPALIAERVRGILAGGRRR